MAEFFSSSFQQEGNSWPHSLLHPKVGLKPTYITQPALTSPTRAFPTWACARQPPFSRQTVILTSTTARRTTAKPEIQSTFPFLIYVGRPREQPALGFVWRRQNSPSEMG